MTGQAEQLDCILFSWNHFYRGMRSKNTFIWEWGTCNTRCSIVPRPFSSSISPSRTWELGYLWCCSAPKLFTTVC